MAALMPLGKQQYFATNGAPLVGGKVYTYAAGTTSLLSTYSDKAGVTPNTNPVILDSRGEATIFWGQAGYKVVLKDSTDATIWTQDNLYAVQDSSSITFAQELITATAGQTVFNLSISYTNGTNSLCVYCNGLRLTPADYTETSTTSVTLATGATVGDEFLFVAGDFAASTTGADLVTYTPAGTGAVATTVQSKLRESVSVLDFGAVGDGVTDDTVAIQKGITEAIASGRRLFIPAGTYNVTKVLGYGLQYCLKINGPICIFGEGQGSTIIRTTKIGGALPDGSGTGYAGAFGIVTAMATPEISFRDLTLDGGNTSTNRTTSPFNQYHKAIFCQGGTFSIQNYHFDYVSIQNFEGEGAYAPNGNSSNTQFNTCYFNNCGGSMGNTSGSTKYFNCRFVNGFNSSIEMALDAYTGTLIVDNCTFFNGTQNTGSVIACQGPSSTDATQRTGTQFIVRNCKFEYTQAWITSTGTAPYRVSPISFIYVGATIVENNVFTNAMVGAANGHGILLIRTFNDTVHFNNNVIKVNDAFFNSYISYGNMGTTKNIQIVGNTTLSETPVNAVQDIYPGGAITCEKFLSERNSIANKTGIAFTVALTYVADIVLPPYKTYTVQITLTVVNSVASVIDFANGVTHLSDLINEVLPVGHYTRYVAVAVPATATFNDVKQYRIRCSGDVANSFSVNFIDV